MKKRWNEGPFTMEAAILFLSISGILSSLFKGHGLETSSIHIAVIILFLLYVRSKRRNEV